MSRLTEAFNKFDNNQNRYLKLLSDIAEFEYENKDSEILKKYKQLLKKKDDIEKAMKDAKDILYKEMLEEDMDLLEGRYIDISLKRPYYKTDFDITQFKKDFKPNSSMYKKYIKQKLVKGNIIVKDPQKA